MAAALREPTTRTRTRQIAFPPDDDAVEDMDDFEEAVVDEDAGSDGIADDVDDIDDEVESLPDEIDDDGVGSGSYEDDFDE